MQIKSLFILVIFLTLVVSVLILAPQDDDLVRAGRPAPTLAPTRTPGAPIIVESATNLLAQPLTKDGAFQRALEIDKQFAIWKEPWTLDTLKSQPNRINIEWYEDRNYDGNEYGPGAERGPVWVIEIKGPVRLRWDNDRLHESITYRIAEKTGNLLSYTLGPYVK